jgi:hypothetical protein
MLQVTVPVRRRLHYQPVYHLVFLTRSQYGLWVFADALGAARKVWLREIGKLDDDDEIQATLFSSSDSMQWLIDSEKESAQKIIEANVRRLLGSIGSFRLVERTSEVFGEAYGIVTDSTVTAAIRALETRGELCIRQAGKRVREYIVGPAV